MLDGVILLWFVLTALSAAFVAIDIRFTPESPVLKWGFILVAAYTGPFGAFLYVLDCREPLVNRLKHGMMTVRKPDSMQPIRSDTTPAMNQEMGGKMAMSGMEMSGMEVAEMGKPGMAISEAPSALGPSAASIAAMTVLSLVMFAAGIAISVIFGGR